MLYLSFHLNRSHINPYILKSMKNWPQWALISLQLYLNSDCLCQRKHKLSHLPSPSFTIHMYYHSGSIQAYEFGILSYWTLSQYSRFVTLLNIYLGPQTYHTDISKNTKTSGNSSNIYKSEEQHLRSQFVQLGPIQKQMSNVQEASELKGRSPGCCTMHVSKSALQNKLENTAR